MKRESFKRIEGCHGIVAVCAAVKGAFLRILDSFFAEGSITTQKRRGVMLELALSSLFFGKVVIYPKEAAQ